MTGSWNPTSIIIPVTLSFLLSFIHNFADVVAAPTRHLCLPEQRDALLELKNEFEIGKPSSNDYCYRNNSRVSPHPTTESWRNNSDCCNWEGITCDTKSGEVIELDLSCSWLYGSFHSNSSLFRLQNLRVLDLTQNDLDGEIPSSIGNLSHLTSLHLSYNQFLGLIPSSIENLSRLTSLHLSSNQFSGQIPSSIGNLSHLTSLELSSNQFSGQIPSSIGNLSNLTFLSLPSNDFFGQIPSSIGNLARLTYLYLSYNNFVGEIPSSFGNLNQLIVLQVDSNKLSGNVPISLLNLTRLSALLLSHNQFTGTIPNNISLLSNLMDFEASNNAFTGTLPSSLFNIPPLIRLDLSDNQLNGTLHFGNISSPSNLQYLIIGSNNFIGTIPRSLSRFVNLTLFDLSHLNTQCRPVDFSIFSHLKSLDDLRLSYLTTTTIDLNDILPYFKTLRSLDISGNLVSATNKSSVSSDPPSQSIQSLYLSGCGITDFPEILRTQHELGFLDVSNNKIKGQVPGWLWTLPNLFYLNLSNNTFISFESSSKKHGLSSVRKPSMIHLFASNNNFTGKIPSFICGLRSLNTLDLSENNYNGSIPRCMEKLKSTLFVLNLRQNNLSGGLPKHIFESLRSLDVGHNLLVGKLPRSLIRFSNLEVLNVESNRINDTFPFWLSSLSKLQVLVLRSNAFHGPIHEATFPELRIIDISHNHFNGTLPTEYFVKWSAMSSLGKNEDQSNEKYMGSGLYYQDSMVLMNKGLAMELVRILTIYTALDFSGNKFEGEIPKSIGLLKELLVLNLSNNAFGGHIPSSMGNLTALESLDVSQNKLTGEIPQELGDLSFLAYMNFSHNQLAGLVPGGTQFRRQNCSAFENNLGLFGPSLDEVCRDKHTPASQQNETTETEEEDEEEISWIAAAIGFIPGIVFGLTIGYILVSYKPEWFMNPFGRNNRRRRNTTTH
ncbi:putative disease resistance protein [Arabidopsis thaliana]|uniref:Receptor-like protein 35 n=1 Tax=Arabidopsis thaliana TaxID=3702 RepID=RLP35_ARATH|nr:receptor like protein 35 [Arabidopsis thaliana]NP_187719.1 receptor like protein 35 [Arabidopsis thaliana]Q9SRL7.1 RecName: Full=Receptor-like protein 35; Short=AtRLP35; Flags: Precursor [Arabidopsis thaliana]AAF01514.1 putative disease resistance protein [Arabidopsis thaliana]AAG50981.1 disease resistance protein, putative; 7647-10478 [Arabidopsis thaliana]AEE75000.1 receptor like protein 35 [Arabidopsis thaliana]ANM65812.1 receptor like protein 35 [Arabidopsis thaliana]|eukprot:NP_001319521.1 receptor like protein 35 [Arabidopsis thaliana]